MDNGQWAVGGVDVDVDVKCRCRCRVVVVVVRWCLIEWFLIRHDCDLDVRSSALELESVPERFAVSVEHDGHRDRDERDERQQ